MIDSTSIYSVIEYMKNGLFFVGKYESTAIRTLPPFVVCFSNSLPDTTSMSSDRWMIYRVGNHSKMLIPMNKVQTRYFWADYSNYLSKKEEAEGALDTAKERKEKRDNPPPAEVNDTGSFFNPYTSNYKTVHKTLKSQAQYPAYVPSEHLLFEFGD
jgi:hypothetical protein